MVIVSDGKNVPSDKIDLPTVNVRIPVVIWRREFMFQQLW